MYKTEVYKKAHCLAIKIHKLSLELPTYELYGEGDQIRRSSKSITANLVEGYGLRNYKSEYIHYLYRAYGSCQETIEHLLYLFEAGSFKDEGLFKQYKEEYERLGKMLYSFIKSVEDGHKSKK